MNKAKKAEVLAAGKWFSTYTYPCESYKRVVSFGVVQEVIQTPNKKRWRVFVEDLEEFSHSSLLKALAYADAHANDVPVHVKHVYAVKGRGSYCAGFCIVVADNPSEAMSLAEEGSAKTWSIGYNDAKELPLNYCPANPLEMAKSAVLDRAEWGE